MEFWEVLGDGKVRARRHRNNMLFLAPRKGVQALRYAILAKVDKVNLLEPLHHTRSRSKLIPHFPYIITVIRIQTNCPYHIVPIARFVHRNSERQNDSILRGNDATGASHLHAPTVLQKSGEMGGKLRRVVHL